MDGFLNVLNLGAPMPRPVKSRMVRRSPLATYYKPRGVPLSGLEEAVLSIEGLEALRLADVKKLDHQTAAEMMKISRPTFSRVLAQARSTVAQALVSGLALRIEGGSFEIAQEKPDRHQERKGRG
jgi:uncharacterized protein